MKAFVARILDTLLPPDCLACETPVEDDGLFCATCFKGANFVSAPLCRCCGVPLPHGGAAGAGGGCARCEAAAPAFTEARSALRYDETAKRAILPFKYADRPEAARGLARLMVRPGTRQLMTADILVPVPLHPSRLRARRYNQAALLAQELARLARMPCMVDALIRTKATLPLESMGLAERQSELKDAICVRRPEQVLGKYVLLIDDVMTSGTTANACAAVLLGAGASRVDVLTAARVADSKLD